MLDAVPRMEWRSLLFVMCFVHSIVQERRKFGPIGWCIPYEFNQSDLSASVQFIQNHMTEMEVKKSKEVTWTTVRYMVAEIQYGGRITDDYDRRLMNTYAEKYFCQAVLDPNYVLFPQYAVPNSADIGVFRNAIEHLPLNDNPEVFGMHTNADLVYRIQLTQEAFDAILETQPKTGGGGGGLTREEVVNNAAGEFLSKMPPDFRLDDVRERINKMGSGNPLNICLRQEVERLQAMIRIARTTLKVLLLIYPNLTPQNLQLAIAGTIALNQQLIDALNSLFDARVPPSWLKASWAAPTLGLWFTGLIQRYEQWDRWLNQGRPKSFWLTGFFNPQGFLTAMRQEVTRKHNGWALDDVVMFTEVTKYDVETVIWRVKCLLTRRS
jgi:dynein heavy chain, axonemal